MNKHRGPITDPSQIKDMPWQGNYEDDAKLFNKVDEYIANEPDPEKRKDAELFVTWYGMGEVA